VKSKEAGRDEDLGFETVPINIRLEPSLRDFMDKVSSQIWGRVGSYLRRLAVYDVMHIPPEEKLPTEWIKDETRTVNLNIVVQPSLNEAIRERATKRGITITDYIRSLAIHDYDRRKQGKKPRLAPDKLFPIVKGLTAYRGQKVVDMVQEAAEEEGLSVSGFQKKLVFEALQKRYGDKFIEAMAAENQEQWDKNEGILKRMLRLGRKRHR